MVDVGFLGCGFIARYHALQLALSPQQCSIVACHDPDRARSEAFAGEVGESMAALGRPKVCDTAEDVLDRCQAVFVCAWTAAHPESVRAATQRGIPVFCEKPLGVDLDRAREVASDLMAAPVHAVGLVLRTSPAMQVMERLLAESGVGEVMNVVFRDDQYLPVGGMYGSSWRSQREHAGAGTLLEHSIHDVDLLDWLVGPIDSVSALSGNFHRLDGIEDSVTAMGGLRGGGSFSLASIWHEVHDRPSQRRIEVFCENALICLEGDIFGPVSLTSDGRELSLEGDQLTDWLSDRGVEVNSTETEFLAAVEDLQAGREPRRVVPGAPEAMRAHEIVDAMYSSATAGGAPVVLPDSP